METQGIACTLPDRERLLLAYLGGTISADEADRLEAHCMTCDECSAELEHGVAIRAALADTRTVTPFTTGGPMKPVAKRFDWRWIAAAATVVLAVSVWSLTRPAAVPGSDLTTATPPQGTASAPAPTQTPPSATATPSRSSPSKGRASNSPSTVLRSPSEPAFRADATREADGAVRIEWPEVQRAVHYIVQVFAGDAREITRRQVTARSIVLPASAIGTDPPGQRLFGKVEAIDALGAVLSATPRFDIPARREDPKR